MMRKRRRIRFKINNDTMTTIVVSSLLFCVAVVVTGIVLACFGIDVSSIVSSSLVCFGTELGICGIMKIFDRNNDSQDRQIEERRKRREERRLELDGLKKGENQERSQDEK